MTIVMWLLLSELLDLIGSLILLFLARNPAV